MNYHELNLKSHFESASPLVHLSCRCCCSTLLNLSTETKCNFPFSPSFGAPTTNDSSSLMINDCIVAPKLMCSLKNQLNRTTILRISFLILKSQGFMTPRMTLGGHFHPYPSTIASVGVILNGSENRVPSLHSANPNK